MIREARHEDLQQILELYLHLHETVVPEESENLCCAWQKIMSDDNHHLIVCEEDGKIVVRDKNLGEALQYIIPQKRAVILLSYFAGYNDTEVANILGVSPTSIARRKKSALLRLRELLEVRVNDE